MLAYIDESGDLGWILDKPYHKGGSSRFLTIAILLTPKTSSQFTKRIIKKIYKKFKISFNTEIKGCRLDSYQINYFVEEVIKLLQKHSEIKIFTLTVKKENVQSHIREDANKLYNYMIRLALLEEIRDEHEITIIPDPRSIKVKSGNSLIDYLQIELWFEFDSNTKIRQETINSKDSYNLKFVDIISHIIWDKYENNNYNSANHLLPYIKNKQLFFNKSL